ncbi:unnamed protein product [Microthlaspi erraticum]|uniref:TIR domain-containing protein n=1 Tax=Microthlaspi erraticum TaxID=1685480 RepID=A0A6D2JCK6_9BRAS|nr:unnamed protein product [Microthlaspi erraticum]
MQKPQVFINFRGKDERQKLVPHLKHHLKASNKVRVFTDEDAPGKPLQSLFKHIRDSRIVIVIFSVNYLESDWCLEELDEIRKCLATEKIEYAIPIFYKVRAAHKALGVVAETIGLSYHDNSALNELDFVKKVVEMVDGILAEIASKEISERNSIAFDASDQSKLHLSKTLEALNLEISYLEGFMDGSAWKDLISLVQSSNRFKISLPESSFQFPVNLQNFDAQGKESIEKAINILALHMISKPTQPALIFSNWDKLDHDTKDNIIYSARKKRKMISQMLKGYNGDVNLEPLFPPNLSPLVEESIWDKTTVSKVPQVRPHPDHRRANSFHDKRDQFYPSPYEMVWHVETGPAVSQGSIDSIGQTNVKENMRDDNPSYVSSLYYIFNRCLCVA